MHQLRGLRCDFANNELQQWANTDENWIEVNLRLFSVWTFGSLFASCIPLACWMNPSQESALPWWLLLVGSQRFGNKQLIWLTLGEVRGRQVRRLLFVILVGSSTP